MSCIYLKNKQGLAFEKREHIFPRMLGGSVRLPKGIVSDEANEIFSKLEQRIANDNNIYSVIKTIFPSLSRHKDVKKLFIGERNNVKAVYYKSSDMETTDITSIIVKMDCKEYKLHSSSEKQFFDDMQFLNETCEKKLLDLITIKIDKANVAFDEIVIGILNQHVYFFIGEDKEYKEEYKTEVIRTIRSIKPANDRQKVKYSKNDVISSKSTGMLNMSKGLEWWLHAKTAFNVLAHITEKEYVLDDGFDDFRKAIIDWHGPISDGTTNIVTGNFFNDYLHDLFRKALTNWTIVSFQPEYVRTSVSLLGLPARVYEIGKHTHIERHGFALCFEQNCNFSSSVG